MTTANLTLPYSLEAEQSRFTDLHANTVWQGGS